MASPAQLMEALPETLPEDFVGWDESISLAQRVNSGSAEPLPRIGIVPHSLTQAAEQQGAGTVSRSLEQQLQAPLPVIDDQRSSPVRRTNVIPGPTMTGFSGIFLHSLWAKSVEIIGGASGKWKILVGISAVLVLISAATVITIVIRASEPSVPPSAVLASTTSTIQQEYPAPPHASSARTSLAPTTIDKEQIGSETARRPALRNEGNRLEQPTRMDDQLHKPPRLQLRMSSAEQPPLTSSDVAVTNINGSDTANAIGAVLGSQHQPRVQLASQQFLAIPSSVALDLLIHKTEPVYPPIARAAQVSGTIVLAVVISETGNVQSVRVVNGPALLRQSAVSAVHTWRFRPYLLNTQPTAIETIITLHFSLY